MSISMPIMIKMNSDWALKLPNQNQEFYRPLNGCACCVMSIIVIIRTK